MIAVPLIIVSLISGLADLKDIAKSEAIEVSLWINISQDHAAFPILYVDVLNQKQEVIQSYECNPSFSTDVIQQQVRAQIIVPYSEKNYSIKVRMEGKDQSLNTLLIRPLIHNVWIKDADGREYLNNYPLAQD